MRKARAHQTDEAWRKFGRVDPYFGVISHDRYHKDELTNEARADFLASGEHHVERIIDWVRESLRPDFSPRRALDFGCGVGRVVLPLARQGVLVTGVDVSEGMLEEAERNCARAGVNNVDFVLSDDSLSRVNGTFDFLHSFIVFQHIPPRRGEILLRQLLDRLEDDGIGALHFTLAHRLPSLGRALQRIRTALPLAHGVLNLLQGRRFSYPRMEMNLYELNRLYSILFEHGCHRVNTRFTVHGGYFGAVLFFRKKQLPLW